MKRTSIALILRILLSANMLLAQSKQKLTINEVTVFLTGAELVSSTNLNLSKGENEIMFTNVAGNINTQSININASNGVVVQSVIFQNNYLVNEEASPRIKSIKDSIEGLIGEKEDMNMKITVINEQIAVLQENRKVSGEHSGLAVAELTKMLDLVNERLDAYLNRKKKLEVSVKKTDEHIARLNEQLNEENKNDYQPGGQLLVKFYAGKATATSVAISYVTPSAGWRATYDIWANNINSPVKLAYKANLFQTTGVKWENVHLILSTGDPHETAQAPVLNPWRVGFYNPVTITTTRYTKPLIDHDKPDAHILTKSEIDVLPTVSTNDQVSLAPGTYQAHHGSSLSVGGARDGGALYIIDGVQVRGTSVNDYVAVDNSGVSTTFDIDIPYTIPSDGQQHIVAIKDHTLPASYKYYVVPRLDKDVFLQAQVTKWEELNLLPGPTNIYFEGTYIGQGMLDVQNVKDTMSISLGRDKKIVVKREEDSKLHTKKVIGTNEHEAFAYSISIRNTRKEPINLTVLDAFPVSVDRAIVVEDKESDAEVDDLTGIMKWDVQLPANETKKLDFSFAVKYPKGRSLAGLR